jgi:hypothetical protein
MGVLHGHGSSRSAVSNGACGLDSAENRPDSGSSGRSRSVQSWTRAGRIHPCPISSAETWIGFGVLGWQPPAIEVGEGIVFNILSRLIAFRLPQGSEKSIANATGRRTSPEI